MGVDKLCKVEFKELALTAVDTVEVQLEWWADLCSESEAQLYRSVLAAQKEAGQASFGGKGRSKDSDRDKGCGKGKAEVSLPPSSYLSTLTLKLSSIRQGLRFLRRAKPAAIGFTRSALKSARGFPRRLPWSG